MCLKSENTDLKSSVYFWQNDHTLEQPFSQLTFLIYIIMYLNVNVRKFQAENAKIARNILTSTFTYIVM